MNKEARYLLASIVESSQDSIVTINLDRIVTSWNKGAEELYGFKATEVIGKPLAMVMLPEDIKELMEKVNDIINEITVPIYETVRVHKSGKHTELEIMLSPVRNPRGEVVGISTIARDITKRKLQERQKDEFIAIASHELKSPVTAIKSYTELLIEQLTPAGEPMTVSIAKKLDTQVDRLIDLIKTLLDTTRLSAGELQLKTEPFDLNRLIEEQIEDLRALSGKHQITFRYGDILPVTADRKLIGRVLTNLISNAIKYSPNGGKVVVTSAETNGGVEVSVTDEGVGIPADMSDKIFDRYFRAKNGLSTEATGIGLGLYISAEIIRQHGGTIYVKSKENEGSTFTFTLPYNGVNTPRNETDSNSRR